jgi:hypothetical protein
MFPAGMQPASHLVIASEARQSLGITVRVFGHGGQEIAALCSQ